VPLLEQRLQTGVGEAIAPHNDGTVNVVMNGYQAQLSGAVKDPEARSNVVAAASAVAGVRSVTDNLEIIASPVTADLDTPNDAEPSDKSLAELDSAQVNITVADEQLTVSGLVQDRRNLDAIIESTMTTFDLNYLSNNVTSSSDIQPIDWSDDLVSIIPELSDIKNPSIDVMEDRITLGGIVSTESDKEKTLTSVSSALPYYPTKHRPSSILNQHKSV